MLECLHIENIAVIERADIRFCNGFTVLTGETGAGKSIVIDAINAVLGERVSRTMVRTGADSAHVTALFSDLSPRTVQRLEEMGFAPDEDGNLLIGRTISAEGKSTCSINGRPATASVLREIGEALVDLHGQHENQDLLHPDRHLEYLDRFGELENDLSACAEAYEAWRNVSRALQAADMDETEKARRIDLLQYQLREIDSAELRVGETEELMAKRTFYRNSEKVADLLCEAKGLLFGDETDGCVSMTERAVSALNGAARYMEQAQPLAEQLQEALYTIQDTANELRGITDLLEFDPKELDETENRLEILHRLTTKYGCDEETVLAYGEACRRELQQIELSDETAKRLADEERRLYTALQAAADALTQKRQAVAERFALAVQEQLSFLDMPHVTVVVDRQDAPLSRFGGDKIEFLLSANLGETPRPLAKIASGGELSRIMLAIKSVLADADEMDTLIFDEIDAGISGRAAQKVGIRLHHTATAGRGRQVLCVTHLAQIAARGDHHYLIAKSVRDGRTYTEVTPLDTQARVEELARIIGGTVTQTAMEAAREMLKPLDKA